MPRDLEKAGWQVINVDSGLYLNALLFEKGIVSFLHDEGEDEYTETVEFSEDTGLTVTTSKSRQLSFRSTSNFGREARDTQKLFDKIFNPGSSCSYSVLNPSRRGEVYSCATAGDGYSLNIHPWQLPGDKRALNEFSGFDVYHTAGCMGGTQIHAAMKNNFKGSLIKHHLDISEPIVRVFLDQPRIANQYEALQFEEIRIAAAIMAKNARPGVKAKVFHHLPWIDYILFGVSLFTQGRMTFKALDQLCKIMLEKKDFHVAKLSEIYETFGLKPLFVSPFDNLFEVDKVGSDTSLVDLVLRALSISKDDRTFLQDGTKEKIFCDQGFAQSCLAVLSTNNFSQNQRVIWERARAELSNEKSDDCLRTVEDLFDVANAMVIACAAAEGVNVASILPVHEKQIQIEYGRRYRKLNSNPVICLTHVPLVCANSLSTCGLTFYFEFSRFSDDIASLVEKGLLQIANKNLLATALGQPATSLERFLEQPASRPVKINRNRLSSGGSDKESIVGSTSSGGGSSPGSTPFWGHVVDSRGPSKAINSITPS